MQYKPFRVDKAILLVFLVGSFNACRAQSGNLDSCKKHIKNARKLINDFNSDNNKLHLINGLSEINQSFQCDETMIAAVEVKLSLFMLMKDYHQGQVFVDSLSFNDFKFPYKKQLWNDYYIAMDFENKLDTLNRNKYYYKIVDNINNYIDSLKNKGSGNFEIEAYYDLYYFKSKIEEPKMIIEELNDLEKKVPSSNSIFREFKNDFYKYIGHSYI